jgi:hypothetical protein
MISSLRKSATDERSPAGSSETKEEGGRGGDVRVVVVV